MKKIFSWIVVFTLMLSCNLLKRKNRDRGQLIVTEKTKPWNMERPYGMVKIPGGTFTMGQSDYDMGGNNGLTAPSRTVTLSSFFMDDKEITNAEYRKFVYDVRDSLARELLAKKAEEVAGDEQDEGIGQYAYLKEEEEEEDLSPYEEYIRQNSTDREGDFTEKKGPKINWDVPLEWDPKKYPDLSYTEVVESFYYPPDQRIDGEKSLDPKKLKYIYKWVDTESALKSGKPLKEHIIHEEIEVYPDTTRWAKDFHFSYNEPMVKDYFKHPAFSNHPVVGINWKQANAFAAWRAEYYNRKNSKKKKFKKAVPYRLPTEVEWEYAARGGLSNGTYPWGGPYLTDDRGCFLANFKPRRGNYLEGKKGHMYTNKVRSFPPNGYGLYDMAGNVSEWTLSSFHNDAYKSAATLNPYIYNRNKNQKKVIRGGSWKDIGYYLQVGVRDWEYADSARSYIGFRTIQPIPESAVTKSSKRKKRR